MPDSWRADVLTTSQSATHINMQVVMVRVIVVGAQHYPENVAGIVTNGAKKGTEQPGIVPVFLYGYNAAVSEFKPGNIPGIGVSVFAHPAA